MRDVQTFKLDSQTAANQLPPLSPVSGRVSDDPPSSELSDWQESTGEGQGMWRLRLSFDVITEQLT